MIKVLLKTPFGFVLKIESENCYKLDNKYDIYIDDNYYTTSNKKIISLFNLMPNTNYNIKFLGLNEEELNLKTEDINYLINIKDYNAIGDGLCNDTSAINTAIYIAPKGSVIIVPKGVYLVDQILLRSDIDLYLEKGAKLLQSYNRKNLAILKGYQKNYYHKDAFINSSWEGNPLDSYCSLIFGKNIENVRIYGDGIIDGNGEEGQWWLEPKVKKIAFRPRNIFLDSCNNISLVSFISENSAAWNIHLFYCKNIYAYDLKINSNPNSPNTDGFDPESCSNVKIIGCHFKVGDDCIAIKSGKIFMSHFKPIPSTNIIISDCFMEEGHGAIVIGSEISCGVNNIEVCNCLFKKTDRGLRIKTRRGRGKLSILDNIRFNNIEMDNVKHCFVINMFYRCDPDGDSNYVKCKDVIPLDDRTPCIKNIFVSNIIAKEITGTSLFIYGLPEKHINNIIVKDSKFNYSKNRVNECPAMMSDPVEINNLGIFIENADNIDIKGNIFKGENINYINGVEEIL